MSIQLSYTTTAINTTIGVYLAGSGSAIITWGDGISDPLTLGAATQYTHTYANANTYTVDISGVVITQLGSGITPTPSAILGIANLKKVLSFGNLPNLTSLSGAFYGATGFTNNASIPSTLPSTITDLNNTFRASNFDDANISSWNVSNVTTMFGCFYDTVAFNKNLSSWDVSKVTNFSNMFRNASKFNNGQLYYITDSVPLNWSINQNAPVLMNQMFYKTPFSQDISSWNISRVTNMTQMFTTGSGNACGMTSTLFDRMLNSWAQQSRQTSVIFYDVKYTIDGSNALATLRSTPWTISATNVSYSPTTVNYGAPFTLTYNGVTSGTSAYILRNANTPSSGQVGDSFIGNGTGAYTFTNVVLTDYNYSTLLILNTTNGSIIDILYINTLFPCFKEGTKILTDKGYIPIEQLRKGDLVKTHIHGYQPIHMIGKRVIYNHARPEREKHQLYKCTHENYPEVFEDLVITGCHCILVSDFTGPEQRAKTLEVNGDIFITDDKYRLPACVDERTVIFEKAGPVPIYHVALENDNYSYNYGVYANGLLVETCSKRYLKEWSRMDIIE